MEVKFGKLSSNSLFLNSSELTDDDNFFKSKPILEFDVQKEEISNAGSRINDYDSNILENNAYRTITDEMLKIEYKISLLENALAKFNDEINSLESLGELIQISDLKDRKQKIEHELAELNKKYSELGLSARLAGQISTSLHFKSGEKLVFKVRNFIYKKILTKISKNFTRNQVMKEALANLNSINSSVDELIKMQVPYGETDNRYEKLTAYLNKANTIHSQISQNINTISNNQM